MLCPRCQTSFCLQRLHSLTPTCTPPCVARWPDIWGEGGGNAPMSLSGSVLRCKLFDLIPVAAAGYWIGANLDRPLLKERRSQYACPTHKLLLTDECSSLPYLYISPGGGERMFVPMSPRHPCQMQLLTKENFQQLLSTSMFIPDDYMIPNK